MTSDQFLFYLLHPIVWLRWKKEQIRVWRMQRKAQKYGRAKMLELRQMEHNLREAADPCCSKCYGQGHRGFNMTVKQWVICRCTYNPRTAEKCEEKPWLRS